MTRKSGLGRGLDALIPSSEGAFEPESALPPGGVIQIPVEQIRPNPRQPRSFIDPAELDGLADSIHEHGVIQPLLVRRGEGAEAYVVIAGERRLRAARQAGLDSVPAVLREASDQQMVELALVENVQRADLSPLEAAEAYRCLVEEFGLAHEDVARRVGKSRAAITNTLRLLKLPPEVQQALADVKISEGHARALLALPSPEGQKAALSIVLSRDLTVRQTEELARRLLGERLPRPQKPASLPEIAAVEEKLRSRLGTRVALHHRGKGGTLTIHYFSEEELDAIVGKILGEGGE